MKEAGEVSDRERERRGVVACGGVSKGDSRNTNGRGHPVNGLSPIAIRGAANRSAYIAHQQYGWEDIGAVHFDSFDTRE